jgi:hypothetical protein
MTSPDTYQEEAQREHCEGDGGQAEVEQPSLTAAAAGAHKHSSCLQQQQRFRFTARVEEEPKNKIYCIAWCDVAPQVRPQPSIHPLSVRSFIRVEMPSKCFSRATQNHHFHSYKQHADTVMSAVEHDTGEGSCCQDTVNGPQ